MACCKHFLFFFYEFMGTLMLSVCYNMEREYQTLLLVVLVISWNHSACHFNSALSVGELIVRSEDFKEGLK
jgi:hypothetical protein